MTIVEYFQTKIFMPSFLKAEKKKKRKALGTCDSDDEKPKDKLCI
jgi:hypothetical protein